MLKNWAGRGQASLRPPSSFLSWYLSGSYSVIQPTPVTISHQQQGAPRNYSNTFSLTPFLLKKWACSRFANQHVKIHTDVTKRKLCWWPVTAFIYLIVQTNNKQSKQQFVYWQKCINMLSFHFWIPGNADFLDLKLSEKTIMNSSLCTVQEQKDLKEEFLLSHPTWHNKLAFRMPLAHSTRALPYTTGK